MSEPRRQEYHGNPLPPGLTWSPVRSSYPGASAWGSLRTLALTLLVCAGVGVGALRGLRPVKGQGRARRTVQEVVLVDSYAEAGASVVAPAGGGAAARPEVDPVPDSYNPHVMDVSELKDPAARDPRDVDPTLYLVPGHSTSLPPAGTDLGGTGSGSGSGGGMPFKVLRAENTGSGPMVEIKELTTVHVEYPEYPRRAVNLGICGGVTLHVLVSETGVPLTAEIESSPHDLLTDEVLRVTPVWRFKPVLVEGNPVRVRVRLLIMFTLLYPNGEERPTWPALPVNRTATFHTL